MMDTRRNRRLRLMRLGAAASLTIALAACGNGGDATSGGDSGKLEKVSYQLSWIGDNSDVGEIIALSKGYYEEAGIALSITPGGTNTDPITMVVSGQSQVAKTGSSPAILLARASGRPVKAIAATLQKHPYAYFSLASNPVRTAQDFVGKTVGVQPTSGETLIAAVMKSNNLDESQVDIQILGDNTEFLVQGKVDAIAGWATNREAARPLDVAGLKYVEAPIWDMGIELYANIYISTDKYISENPEILAGFVEASARGWKYAKENPEEALDLLMKKFPSLTRESQKDSLDRYLDVMFNDTGAASSWGQMEDSTWQAQVDLWEELGEFDGTPPRVADLMTTEILDRAGDKLPRF